jgi:hypothetical protein
LQGAQYTSVFSYPFCLFHAILTSLFFSNDLNPSGLLEGTYVHPLFYGLALEIAELKTNRKGANAIEAFQRQKNAPKLSQQELETIFETDTSSTLVQVALDFFLNFTNIFLSLSLQEFQFVSDVEARDLIKVVCRAMHGPDTEFLAFAPMPQHIVFEKLIGFKPHELFFMKTSATIRKQADRNRIRVKVQGPEMDGSMFEINCEKARDETLADVFNGVHVIQCVIIGIDLQNYNIRIGNRKWMMAMHEINVQANPELRSHVPPMVPKDPADTVIRSRLSFLHWFKNISINEAKQVRQLQTQSLILPLPDAVIRAGCQVTWH